MTTHNQTNNAALTADHRSVEAVTAAEADAIAGGRTSFLPSPDADGGIRIDLTWVKTVVSVAKTVAGWLGGLFEGSNDQSRRRR